MQRNLVLLLLLLSFNRESNIKKSSCSYYCSYCFLIVFLLFVLFCYFSYYSVLLFFFSSLCFSSYSVLTYLFFFFFFIFSYLFLRLPLRGSLWGFTPRPFFIIIVFLCLVVAPTGWGMG